MTNNTFDYIIIEKQYGSLEYISNFIQERSLASKLNFKRTWELMLVVDEICNAIIICSNDNETELKLIWKDFKKYVEVEILEEGEEFNPLVKHEDEEYCSEIEGMGVYLISKMVDKATYQRCKGINKICIIKNKCKD
ncbi:ATP-binding protein [bacterium]|nr:ATP-binding protein [bacterium]